MSLPAGDGEAAHLAVSPFSLLCCLAAFCGASVKCPPVCDERDLNVALKAEEEEERDC